MERAEEVLRQGMESLGTARELMASAALSGAIADITWAKVCELIFDCSNSNSNSNEFILFLF